MLLSFRAQRSCQAVSTLAALVALSTLAGCLEANAASADGGATADASPHTDGRVGTDAGSPHGDASSDGSAPGTDATTSDGGSHSDGATQSCKNPTPAFTNCAACDESSCKTALTAAVTACPSFYSCFASTCDCTDAHCIETCAANDSPACNTALGSLSTCSMQMCAAACSGDAGSTTPDATTSSGCKNPTTAFTKCATCDESSCSADLSAAVSACPSFYSCFANCNCSDTSCADTCAANNTTTCDSALTTLSNCQTSMCASACSTTTSTDGGSAPTVPDCLDPTTEEATLYSTCSACDAAHCQSDVTAAVAACTTYYGCVASTDCIDIVACNVDETTACTTAATALNECQTANCATDCE